MAITAIQRDFVSNVSIIRITTTDTLAVVGAAGYLTAQSAIISALNNGDFEWLASDTVLVSASNGWGNFTISADFTSLNQFGILSGTRMIIGTTSVYAGGGTTNTFSVPGLTSTSSGTATIKASTNSVSVNKAVAGTNTLAITFSADPGAGTTVGYTFSTGTTV